MKGRVPRWVTNPIRRREKMPQIIVTADKATDRAETSVMLKERVSVSDFESDHFAAQLVERVGWAVSDAHEVEQEKSDR
jgi:mannitol-specific phosphotransferase system IIBC component